MNVCYAYMSHYWVTFVVDYPAKNSFRPIHVFVSSFQLFAVVDLMVCVFITCASAQFAKHAACSCNILMLSIVAADAMFALL